MKAPLPQPGRVWWIVRTMIYWLKILGLAPFSVESTTSIMLSRHGCINTFRFSTGGLIYNILLSILVTILAAIRLEDGLSNNFQSTSTVADVIFILAIITRALTTCVVIILWTLRQRSAIPILNRLLEIEVQMSGLKIRPSDKKMTIFLTLHLIINGVIWTAFWVTEFALNSAGDCLMFTWTIMAAHLVYWFNLEYVIAVTLIARGLETVNNNLLMLYKPHCQVSRSQSVNDFSQVVHSQTRSKQLATLRELIKIRVKLTEVSQDIEGFFSFGILCCTIPTFFTIIWATYEVIISPDKSIPILSRIIFWFCNHLYPMILLSFKVTEIGKQAKSTAQIVCKLLISAVTRDIETELEHFSLELLHDNFVFTAYGVFTLDLTLLTSIAGATMTYLVVSLQFGVSAG